jgi:hypothetical protein
MNDTRYDTRGRGFRGVGRGVGIEKPPEFQGFLRLSSIDSPVL